MARAGKSRGEPRYRPPWLLRNPHVMNLSLMLPRRGVPRGVEETREIAVGSGARVRVHVSWPVDRERTICVFVHGFTGSAEANYVRGFARKAHRRGFGVVRINLRGCGDALALAPNLGHVGLDNDVCEVLRSLTATGRVRAFHLIGFSMGGNLSLRAAAALASESAVPLRGVVAVSPVLDVERCAIHCDTDGRARLYRDAFVRSLRRSLRELARIHDLAIDLPALARVRTLREFDAFYTVPTWGFASVVDYWRNASSTTLIERIGVPVLTISARDDVLVPIDSLAPLRHAARPDFRFLATPAGGHCAFRAQDALGDEDRHWAENRALDFITMIEQQGLDRPS